MTKRCPKCGLDLPADLEHFPARRQSPSGLASWCRTCQRAQSRTWFASHPEQRRAKLRRWREAGRAKTTE